MSAPMSTDRRLAGRISPSDRGPLMLMVVKDVAALIAVALFVLAVSLWGAEIETMILTARGQ